MISVVICTFNRVGLLCECIQSLLLQTVSTDYYEIIVVDNGSTDNTAIEIKKLLVQQKIIKYVCENTVGLSHARNAGYKAARFDWVSYIDDDALANKDYIEKILWTIKTFNWDCFGGVFNRWFKYGEPDWYPENFGTNKYDFDTIKVLPEFKYACGGVITIRKSVLKELKGFDPDFGMSGNSIGYGEETELQNRIRKAGYTIGFNPQIQIDHLVAKYKLSVWWHLRAAWANEKAGAKLAGKDHYPFSKTFFSVLRGCYKQLKHLKKLKQKNYYWQNFVFDYAEPLIRRTSALFTLYFNFK